MRIRYPIIFGLICVLFAACTSRPPEEMLRIDVMSAKGFFPEAQRYALDWDEEARLVEIRTFFGGEVLDSEPRIEFKFETLGNGITGIYVICRYSDCETRVLEDVTLLPAYPDENGIDLDVIRIDSVEAALIGQENGGFQCSSIQDLFGSVRLGPSLDGRILWNAYFSCAAGTIYVYVDPLTGEVFKTSE